MKKYKLLGGGEITASTPQEIISELMKFQIFEIENKDEWMFQTSQACYLQKRALIRITSDKEFVEDLIQYGFLKEVEND